jgi:hypothetical protein
MPLPGAGMNMGTLCFGVDATVGSTIDADRLTLCVAGLKAGRPTTDVLGVPPAPPGCWGLPVL